ncbi:CHAT domain-containing protein [Suillus subalutaceus]|uniref:CHAT domain-containing protein n=1 Tax=Suillus subalutaceus TaxID=48586 RepID=UPI001B87A9DB|nr:CHAT domain-containing protein [Suillus subalutaceus]KAG1835853.1 CHAT domain-containing protein [Suillus subalutaceus]
MDTRALNHILTHSSDYQKSGIILLEFWAKVGASVSTVISECLKWSRVQFTSTHGGLRGSTSSRRTMNPAFGPAQICALTDIFIRKLIKHSNFVSLTSKRSDRKPRFMNLFRGVELNDTDVILFNFNKRKLLSQSDRVNGADFHPRDLTGLYNSSVNTYNHETGALVKTLEVSFVLLCQIFESYVEDERKHISVTLQSQLTCSIEVLGQLRIPAGIYISINIDPKRHWKSTIKILSSDKSVAWGDTVTLSSHASPAFSVEIRASYEVDQMLGSGEVIGKLQKSWDELLGHGDEPFALSFPPVRGVHPSLTLKAAIVHTCDDQDGALSYSLIDSEIARDTDMGHAQFAKYVTLKRPFHLCRAVEHFQLVLDQRPVDHPDHAGALTNLAYARLESYIQGYLQDIETTTSRFRETLALRPQGHPDHASTLYNLITALNSRYRKEHTAVHIHESAELCCKLLPICPEGSYLRSNSIDSVVDYVFSEYNNLPIDTSDESIHLRRNVLELYPVGQQLRPRALHLLARAIGARFTQRGSVDDIDETIQLRHEAGPPSSPVFTHVATVTILPELLTSIARHWHCAHVDRAAALSNLALALNIKYNKFHVIKDLNEAIGIANPFGHTRKNTDVEEAINLCQESLVALSSLHPDMFSVTRGCRWPIYLIKKSVLVICHSLLRTSDWHHGTPLGFPDRIHLTHNWTIAILEQHDHRSALEAYSTFFELLDAHLSTRSSATSRRKAAANIRYSRTLPVDVPSAGTICDKQWNSWSRAVAINAHPKLAHNYLELSGHVSNAAQNSAPITDTAAADRAATEYRKLTERWEAAVAEIRNLQAFSRFLLPPSYADLQAAARHGPVIILIARKYSCSAIIVPTSGEPHHTPLPSVTLADLNNLKVRFTKAIRYTSIIGPKVPRNDLIVLLRTVWDETMLPIVNVLQHNLKLKFRSRIWLCPTAVFTSIPLHAAHPFRTKADNSNLEPCLEDLYICSYTPTLSALIQTDDEAALLAVDGELKLVHKLVPAIATRTIIFGKVATRVGALEALQENTWVHLACHGPYNSHFVMGDEPLTLLDIMKRDIPHVEFAFLSACHTAVGDEEMPDEVIHLAAGLQLSGFKSIVGTLWEVNDAVAKHVVEAFYRNMFKHLKDCGAMDCTKAA